MMFMYHVLVAKGDEDSNFSRRILLQQRVIFFANIFTAYLKAWSLFLCTHRDRSFFFLPFFSLIFAVHERKGTSVLSRVFLFCFLIFNQFLNEETKEAPI